MVEAASFQNTTGQPHFPRNAVLVESQSRESLTEILLQLMWTQTVAASLLDQARPSSLFGFQSDGLDIIRRESAMAQAILSGCSNGDAIEHLHAPYCGSQYATPAIDAWTTEEETPHPSQKNSILSQLEGSSKPRLGNLN